MQEIVLHAGFCAHNRIIILEQDEHRCVFGMLEENAPLVWKLKKAWKHLLKKYHPDLIAGGISQQEAQKNVPQGIVQEDFAAIIRRINRSYKRIEVWFLTGKIRDYDAL